MADLKLKDTNIENLEASLVHKDTHITSLRETVSKKEHDIKEAQNSRS